MKNPVYPVFFNKKTNKKLVFYPVKKNANSSAKLFFASHLGLIDSFFFIEDDIPRFKQTKKLQDSFEGKTNLTNWFKSKNKFTKLQVDHKACIIRDPLKRFLSAYKNRVLFHKDKEFYNHTVDMVIEKLENNIFENKHFLPQNYWLGNDLSYFNIIGITSNIKTFEQKINNFFGQDKKFPKIQTGGKEFVLELNTYQITKVKKIYTDDYSLLGDLIKN